MRERSDVCMRFKSDSIKIQLIVNVLKAQLFCRFKGKRNFNDDLCVYVFV